MTKVGKIIFFFFLIYNFSPFGTTSDDEKMEGLEIYIDFLWSVCKKNERMEKVISFNLLQYSYYIRIFFIADKIKRIN